MEENIISINSLHYFNAHTRSAEDVVNTFIARKGVLKELEEGLQAELPNSIPQHYMIIGSRGMGKSTLLRRLEISIRSPKLKEKFIPILFPEEQYNIDRLSKFWLNSLDALADSLESESNFKEAEALDQLIKALSEVKNENELSNLAFDALMGISKKLKRRTVFLVDNIDILFDGISSDEQFSLRKIMTNNGAPIFISASTSNPLESQNYDAAFYDAFDNIYLERLSQNEMRELLLFLAEKTGKSSVIDQIYHKTGQLDALHSLTGGNPRIAVFMFQMIVNGFSNEIFENLNALLDIITPLYKSNFEQLSKQAQIIVDALALNWDPCNLDMLSHITKLENNQLSAQIERLIRSGWIERGSRYSEEKNIVLSKVKNYTIRERFFNIWYIMRRASRRQRGDLKSLTCFLETFYTPAHLNIEKTRIVKLLREKLDSDRVTYGLALSKTYSTDEDNVMEREIFQAILMHTEGNLEKISKYLNPEIIPIESYANYMGGEAKKYIRHIDLLMEAHDFEKANEFINSLIGKKPDDEYIWSRYGESFKAMGKLEEAEAALTHSIKLAPSAIWAWDDLAEVFRLKGDEGKYEATLLQGMDETKEMTYLAYKLAYFYREKEKISDAIKLLEDAIDRNPDYEHTRTALIGILLTTNQNEYGIKLIEESLQLFPRSTSLWFYKAVVYWVIDANIAIESFEKALEINPEVDFYWWHYGKLLESVSKKEQAKHKYQEALKRNVDNHKYWLSYGEFLEKEFQDYKGALKAVKKAISISPSSYAWEILGKIHGLKRNFKEAEKAYRKSIKLDKNNYAPHGYLALLNQYIFKDYEKSYKFYHSSLKINVDQPTAWLQLANVCHLKLKRYDEAKKAYEKSFTMLPPTSHELSNYIFLLSHKLGLIAEAKNVLQDYGHIIEENKFVFFIHKALLAQYEENVGIARDFWKIALSEVSMEKLDVQINLISMAASVSEKMGFGKELLTLFAQTEVSNLLRPLYEGVKALVVGNIDYLLNIAPEIGESAREIYQDMKEYQS